MRLRLPALAALAVLSAAVFSADLFGAFKPSKTPDGPGGVRAACDVPVELHMRNTGGMGRGGPGTGAGLCVFTSVEIAARWQSVGQLDGFQKWMTRKPGGGSPPKLASMIAQFCREKGVAEPVYVQHTGGDAQFLELAMRTRRVCGVTYSGQDDFYGGPIDHMVCLVHLDANSACIVDNNRPGNFVWMSRAEFLQRWKARGGGWAVVLLDSPPPPAGAPKAEGAFKVTLTAKDRYGNPIDLDKYRVPGPRLPGPPAGGCSCECAPCECAPCECEKAKPQQFQQCPSCPNGRCPLQPAPSCPTCPSCPNGVCPLQPSARPAAPRPPPVEVDAPQVDRANDSYRVSRSMGGGTFECGTGSVIASGKGKCLLLTNSHVVPDGSRPVTVYARGREVPAKWVASSRLAPDQVDLALLVVEAELPAVPFADQAPPAGTPVYQWGYGGRFSGQPPTAKSGVTVEKGGFIGPKGMRTTILSQSGDSGSGVFDADGRLVAVCWGGDGTHQFCVSLEPAKKWVREKTPAEFAARKVEAAPAPRAVSNHGIDRDELDALTKDGEHRYWIGGTETTRRKAHDLITAGGSLVDDSDRYFLSVVGDQADAKKLDALFASPGFARFKDRLHVRVYPRDSWVVRERLAKAVTLQEPAPKGGRVVGALDTLDEQLLLLLLQQVFDPPAKPMPAKPADGNPNNAQPAVPPPAAPAQQTPWVAIALALAAVWYFRRPSTSKEK